MADTLHIEILADGTAKITTSKVSGANHKNADELLKFFAQMLGGETVRTRRTHAETHVHAHAHDHVTEGE